MKKLYTLLLLVTSILAFSQGSINFDDPTKWTQGTAAFTSYSDHSYTDGVFSLACTDVIRNGLTVQDGFVGGFGTYSLRLQNDATTDISMKISSGGVGNFSFSVRRWDGTPATDFTVEYSTNNGSTWTASSTINASLTNDSDWKTVNGIINSANANIIVRVKSNGTTERIMVDDFSWTAPSSNPSLLISSPSNGAVYSPVTNSVNVSLSISNFNVALPAGGGDGHIHYEVTKDAVQQGVVMKYDTTPIALTGLTPGSYSVFVQLVNNAHNPIAPAVNATVTFVISSYTVVANLATLRADVTTNGAGKYYQLSSNPVITYARDASNRNQKYIQDTSAGILIDDVPGTISTSMVIGDAISGLRGQTSLFSGVLQLLPLENATVASSGNIITPQVVTAAAITANIEMYESELVRINAATFTTADGTTVTYTTNTNFNMNDGSDIAFRTMFAEADYIGQIIPTGAANRVFLVAEFNGTAQVVARSLADVTLSTNSFNAIDGFTMYPNPLTGNVLNFSSAINAEMNVQIFDMLGKQILTSKVNNNTLNIPSLNAGVYIVKITEEGKTATRKLVVR
jgi:hypothetical protein